MNRADFLFPELFKVWREGGVRGALKAFLGGPRGGPTAPGDFGHEPCRTIFPKLGKKLLSKVYGRGVRGALRALLGVPEGTYGPRGFRA